MLNTGKEVTWMFFSTPDANGFVLSRNQPNVTVDKSSETIDLTSFPQWHYDPSCLFSFFNGNVNSYGKKLKGGDENNE